YQTLKNCIVSMDYAENIIVIKTVSGMAMAVGTCVDRLSISGILGCIAGDDTLFLAIKDKTHAEKIIGEINDVIKYAH
ncbi:MAG: arginine repressor, partial [Lachnospiraceae bacterium]|nr:arginine repressor [Lachnospiraceae bacterium]